MSTWNLHDLRAANATRQDEWCREGGHPDLSYRGLELAGEAGEACNEMKKLERERHGWRGSRTTVAKLAEELADVVICADLCALNAGIDLHKAVEEKFNATTRQVGLTTLLGGVDPGGCAPPVVTSDLAEDDSNKWPLPKRDVTLHQDVRNLIMCDTEFGWRGDTTVPFKYLRRLSARGWLAEGEENNEYYLTDEGHKIVGDALEAIERTQS